MSGVPSGAFDKLLVPAAWFADDESVYGWFDDELIQPSGGTITGNGATAASAQISAATGTVKVTAAGATAAHAQTSAATGAATIAAAGATNSSAETSAATGTVKVSATAATAAAAQVSAATGTVKVSAAGASSAAPQVSAATGTVAIAGAAADAATAQASAASGTVAIAGNAATAAAPQVSAATASIVVGAAGATSSTAQTSSATGTVRVTGAGASSATAQGDAAAGTVALSGDGATTAAAQVSAAIGAVRINGAAATVAAAQISAATGTVEDPDVIHAHGATAAQPQISAATGTVTITGNAATSASAQVSAATGAVEQPPAPPPAHGGGGGRLARAPVVRTVLRAKDRAKVTTKIRHTIVPNIRIRLSAVDDRELPLRGEDVKTPEKINFGARVRFEAEFSLGGAAIDVKNPVATITKAGTVETLTLKNGIEAVAKGRYAVFATADRAGVMSVRFSTDDGNTHRESYMVSDAPMAAPVTRTVGVVWPDGYTRERAITELGIQGSGRSDAYLLGMITQKQSSARADAVARHDDRQPLPVAADEKRAQEIAAATIKKAGALEFKKRDPKAEAKALADARCTVRAEILRRRS